jgi:hypothetical protein
MQTADRARRASVAHHCQRALASCSKTDVSVIAVRSAETSIETPLRDVGKFPLRDPNRLMGGPAVPAAADSNRVRLHFSSVSIT